MVSRLISFAGLLAIVGFAILISKDRKRISWRLVAWGVALQIFFALIILCTAPGLKLFEFANLAFNKLYEFAGIGAGFLFGQTLTGLNDFVILNIGATLVFVASLMSILFYLRVIPALVCAMARVMRATMRASGAESLSAAMFVFMGIESVTGLKKYLKEMTTSELFTVMTGFMATIAGTVMAIYARVFGASAGHLLAASIMSAPAAILISKIMIPETGEPSTCGSMDWGSVRSDDSNVIEAAASGAADGVKLAINIGAMLLAFIALIGMLDALLGYAGAPLGAELSFRKISGYVFAPVAFIMGVPWSDCLEVGQLLGVKVIFNEFIAYQQMQGMVAAGSLSPRSTTIATYALCSFANFGSLAILIGGVAGLAQERKKEVARLGLKALLAGFLAGCMTAAIAGALVNH